MNKLAIVIVIVVLLAFYFSTTEHAKGHKHYNKAYLIHERTTEICYECAAVVGYFYDKLWGEKGLEIHAYHIRNDYDKVQALEQKYDVKLQLTPSLLVIHDDGHHELHKGYGQVYPAINRLKYHPYMEKTLGW